MCDRTLASSAGLFFFKRARERSIFLALAIFVLESRGIIRVGHETGQRYMWGRWGESGQAQLMAVTRLQIGGFSFRGLPQSPAPCNSRVHPNLLYKANFRSFYCPLLPILRPSKKAGGGGARCKGAKISRYLMFPFQNHSLPEIPLVAKRSAIWSRLVLVKKRNKYITRFFEFNSKFN